MAMTQDRVIGQGDNLPWDLPEDRHLFKNLTSGNTIIMGRKTYESINRPLADRHNLVLSRTLTALPGVTVCSNFIEGLETARIYRGHFNRINRGCITNLPADYELELFEPTSGSRDNSKNSGTTSEHIEYLADASICMMHLSRLSEEVIVCASAEFAVIELPDAFATGSSIMPQKKNPDVAELVRGKTGRVFGDLMALLTLMKSLPLSYNRDMQEDKALLFDAADMLSACVDITAQLLPKIKFNTARMQAAAHRGYLNATDLADYLVTKGMPFREAHHCVGQIVRYAVRSRKELHELSLVDLQKFSARIEGEIFDFLKTSQMIDRRTTHGGTATRAVKAAIKAAEKKLNK